MKPLLLALATLRGADLATTQVVLGQGGVEANPLLPQSAPWSLGVGVTATVGELYALDRLSKRHPRAAKWIAVGAMSLEGAVVFHNARQVGTTGRR